MKQLATLGLVCLLTIPCADAATVQAPAAVQSPVVAVLVDLDQDTATLHLDVPGIGNATVTDATGRGGIELPNVPNGIHAWSLTIQYPDGATEHHEGAVSVLDVASLVQAAVQGAALAGSNAAATAQEAAEAAQAAQEAAEAAKAAAEAVPRDVARTKDVAALVKSADFAAHVEAEAERHAEDAEARAAMQAEAAQRLEALDRSVGSLLLVVVLGVALVAWYVAQLHRAAPTDQDRALLQAVAVRLEIAGDAPEYLQALHDLDVERRSRPRLLDRLRGLLARPHPEEGGGVA